MILAVILKKRIIIKTILTNVVLAITVFKKTKQDVSDRTQEKNLF